MRSQILIIPIVVLGILFLKEAPPLHTLVSATCVTDTSTTWQALEVAKSSLTEVDSAIQVKNGLPYPIDSVEVESNEQICAAVVAAYNALIPSADSVHRINHAIVMRADSIFVLMHHPENTGWLRMVYFFSSTYQFITRYEEPG